MTKDEALALHADLERLVGHGPGADKDGLLRVKQIRLKFGWALESTSYIREKMTEVAGDFDVWLSARKWQRIGEERARANLASSLFKLAGAIESQWREPDSSSGS